jgi:hypothetical protein
LCRLKAGFINTGTAGRMRRDMKEPVRFIFRGRLESDSFAEFAQHRARRLDIGLYIRAGSAEEFVIDVNGANDLVDAFEMACSLGPLDCIVTDVLRAGKELMILGRGKDIR